MGCVASDTVRMVVFDRHYRLPAAYAWLFRGLVLSFGLIIVLSLADNQGGEFGIVVGVAAFVCLGGLWLRSERSWPRAGLYETPEGLRVVRIGLIGGLRDELLRWGLITRFEPGSLGLSKRAVLAVGTNGVRVRVIGAKQGTLFKWDGGETGDLIGVLNERLATWRTAHGNETPQVPSKTASHGE